MLRRTNACSTSPRSRRCAGSSRLIIDPAIDRNDRGIHQGREARCVMPADRGSRTNVCSSRSSSFTASYVVAIQTLPNNGNRTRTTGAAQASQPAWGTGFACRLASTGQNPGSACVASGMTRQGSRSADQVTKPTRKTAIRVPARWVGGHHNEESWAHGPRLVMARDDGVVGWVQPTIWPGVVVGCTHPKPDALTYLGP